MTSKRKSDLIIMVGCAIIMAVFWVLPPMPPLTQIGMRVIGVFIGTVVLLSFVDPVWPMLISIALLSRTGVASLGAITAASIGNWIFLFVLLSFIMTYALTECGFMDRMVAKFMGMKFVMRTPWTFTLAISVLGVLVGSFIDQVPAVAFMLAFANKVYKELGYTREDDYPHMVNFMVAYGAIIGGAMTPISHSFALMGMAIYEGALKKSMSLVTYLAFGVPTGLVLFIAMLIIVRLFCHPDMSHFAHFDINKVLVHKGKMDLKEKIVVISFFGAVFMWVLPGVAGMLTDAAWVGVINDYGITFWAILSVVVMTVVYVDGKPILNVTEVVNTHINWGIMMFVAIAIYLGSALAAKSTGVTEWITMMLHPIIATVSPSMVVLVITTAGVFMTNFSSNVTTITVMTGVGVVVAMGSNGAINPAGMALCTTMAGSCAYLLPSSFAGIALLHSNEYSNRATILRYGFMMMIVSSIAIGLIGYSVGCAITG